MNKNPATTQFTLQRPFTGVEFQHPVCWKTRKMLVLKSFILALFSLVAIGDAARIKRQEIGIVCSACEESRRRLNESPICCKCISESASCNNRVGRDQPPSLPIEDFPVRAGEEPQQTLKPGLMCEADCLVFGDCSCRQIGEADLVDLRTTDEEECAPGQKLCCNPVSTDLVETRAGLVSPNNPLGRLEVDSVEICNADPLAATQNFALGVTCGRRDSRTYRDSNLQEGFTNPGEWPWSVMIFNGDEYLGAGALLDNNIVVTVGHKVRDFTRDASRLRVRMGDWNPNTRDPREEHPEITVRVECVKIHPRADLDDTLAYNVAVLKLENDEIDDGETPQPIEKEKLQERTRVLNVVSLRSADAPERNADRPEGDGDDELVLRGGLVSDLTEFDPLGRARKTITPSYINTVCLPQSEFQFRNYDRNCWVAAWGSDLRRQREVDLPLWSKSQCESSLQPEFQSRGVNDWNLSPSEICAGGVPGKDTCEGEGGAPLVCLDPELDQYFAVGLVNYGFSCNGDIPAIYVNLADPTVKRFITDSFHDIDYCSK